MKRKNIINALCFGLLAASCALMSCNDWTDTESIDRNVNRPQDQNPELWAAYTEALRAYKKSEHFIVYARMHNSPEVATSEKDFMRCLPDSLDIVSLTNADNLSDYDIEDLSIMLGKGTKILYQVDYAVRAAEWSDATTFNAYLDKAVATVAKYHLDGFSFTGIPKAGDDAAGAAAKLLVGKLGAEASKLLVFEGNPLFVAAEDRAKVDYFVLDTENTDNVTDLKMKIFSATGYAAVPEDKLLLAASADSPFFDEELVEHGAIGEVAKRVVSLGPLAGLGIYEIGKDYYDPEKNYKVTRDAIQMLNPSK